MTSFPADLPTTISPQSTVQNGPPLVAHITQAISDIRGRSPLSRILIVTPSSYSAFFLKRAVTDTVCADLGSGLFNVEFMRIDDVADILFEASPDRPDKSTMTPLISFQLIQNAVANLRTAGPLTEHSQNDSTIAAIQRTLQELALVDQNLDTSLRYLAKSDNSDLYAQLLEIQREYRSTSTNYLSSEQKVNIATQTALNDADLLERVLAPHIIVIAAPQAPNATTALRDNLGRMPSARIVNVIPSDASNLSQVETDRTTRFYSAMGAADEPRSLIRNIVKDARNGVKFGETAIFYPSADYASRIKDALDAAQIPNCGPSSKTLAETPAGKFVALLLNMISDGMRRDAFASWTSSSPVIDPRTGSRVPAVQWETASRNAKIARFDDKSPWQSSLDRYARSMVRRANRIADSDDALSITGPESFLEASRNARRLKRFLTDLTSLISNRERTRWSEWVDWLEAIIARYLSSNDTNDHDVNGLSQINESLKQIRSLDELSPSPVDLPKFTRTVQRLLLTNEGASSGWGSAVLVAPLTAGTATAFKAVHVLGMAEGSLPGGGRFDPLLPDNLRQQIDPESETLLTRRKRLEIDQLIFQMALSSAPSNHLYWNKAVMGATNEAYPSPWFIDEIQKANSQSNTSAKSLMDPQSKLVEVIHPLSEIKSSALAPSSRYEFGLRDTAIRASNEPTRSRLLTSRRFAALAAGHAISKARNDSSFGPYDGNVGVSFIRESGAWRTSATALESYAQCPYRFFLAQELNVDERIDPEESLELSALDRGILVHKILEEFLEHHGADRSPQGSLALREIAQTEFERFQRQDFVGYPAVFELEKTRLLRDLETWHRTKLDALVGFDGEFRTEESFPKDDDSLGQIRLNDGFTVQLRGQIDLIAISPERDRALVLDFKTGGSSYTRIDKDITDSGQKLQLPIYSMVANEILGGSVDIETAYWFVFLSGADEYRPKSYATFESAAKEFEPVIATIIDGIRSGSFPARPGKTNSYGDRASWDNCKYCPYDAVCPSNRLISWERKKTAPMLEDYVALAE